MNKTIILAIFLVIASNISTVSAWDWITHDEIAESNYYSLPEDMQHNLNLDLIKKGSISPDFIFLDFKYHSYPNSYGKAIYWLNKGQSYYKKGDFYYASYCYGVSSHYITDSFSAPHAAGMTGVQHLIYETKASFLKPEVVDVTGSLNSTMYKGDLNGTKN
ncbi:zinc dependent phospholipase C family protein [Methanobacterium sp.]|uniref:zinc dependent phospholipase C family protein n=1 Tax=Methanobacterium sp. TaxID=2164 RepID=UPI003C7286E0